MHATTYQPYSVVQPARRVKDFMKFCAGPKDQVGVERAQGRKGGGGTIASPKNSERAAAAVVACDSLSVPFFHDHIPVFGPCKTLVTVAAHIASVYACARAASLEPLRNQNDEHSLIAPGAKPQAQKQICMSKPQPFQEALGAARTYS
eukprot:86055-Pelagomonas_calceolata.AAC.13